MTKIQLSLQSINLSMLRHLFHCREFVSHHPNNADMSEILSVMRPIFPLVK